MRHQATLTILSSALRTRVVKQRVAEEHAIDVICRGMAPGQCRAARRRLGWSQAQLARAAGVSQSLISVFERGQYVPVGDGARRIAAALEAAGMKLKYDQLDVD